MDDESLFAHHARFKTDGEAPEGWYREGETFAEGAWVVDLDLFVEITQGAEAWESLRGETIELAVGENEYEIDLPQDVTFDECWTLTGCGLFEPAPGVTEEQLAEAEDFGEDSELGRFGDLHVIPMVGDAPPLEADEDDEDEPAPEADASH
ncbi:MAG: hypothetical protein P1V36_08495 [Planctomycetota bacterium]|nr:hypothetical protein [Planctomycetota bacterium]